MNSLIFTTVYAIGRQGIAKMNLTDESKDLTPLLETILKEVPAAQADSAAPLKMQVFNLGYDNFLGRLAIGRIYDGTIKMGQTVFVKELNGQTISGKVTKIYTFNGVARKEVQEAIAGDIAMIAGLPNIYIGETVCQTAEQEAMPAIKIDEPTIRSILLLMTPLLQDVKANLLQEDKSEKDWRKNLKSMLVSK